MNKTVSNIEETIGKTVGRRQPPTDAMRLADSTIARAVAWNKALPALMPLRGQVSRFHTHEEADEWLNNQQIAAKARRMP